MIHFSSCVVCGREIEVDGSRLIYVPPVCSRWECQDAFARHEMARMERQRSEQALSCLLTCRLCHADPTIESHRDHWPWCGDEYTCTIQCPNHPDNCATGSSLDNAIDAQREAEAAWNNLQNQGEKA